MCNVTLPIHQKQHACTMLAVLLLLGIDIKSWGPAQFRRHPQLSLTFAARDSSSCPKSLIYLVTPPYHLTNYTTTAIMPGGGAVPVTGTSDVNRVEAPVTVRAYLIVAFAAFGGIFFGYDTGWMGGVLNMDYFINQYTGAEYPELRYPGVDHLDPLITEYRKKIFVVAPWQQSLVTSILYAGYVEQPLM